MSIVCVRDEQFMRYCSSLATVVCSATFFKEAQRPTSVRIFGYIIRINLISDLVFSNKICRGNPKLYGGGMAQFVPLKVSDNNELICCLTLERLNGVVFFLVSEYWVCKSVSRTLVNDSSIYVYIAN